MEKAHNIKIGGIWARRLQDSVENWMLHVSDQLLTDSFKNRPGIQGWIGEHWGKYIDGAISLLRLTDNKQLADKIKKLAETLISCQEDDGYIGTYLEEFRYGRKIKNSSEASDRFNYGWDIWVSKYSIIGLLSYYKLTGDGTALVCACRLLDLVCETFMPEKELDLNNTDCQSGLASGSILEAVMLVYKETHNKKYLEFAEYIINHYWEKEDNISPKIMKNLKSNAPVANIGTAKGYEMISCFVGLCEYCIQTKNEEITAYLIDLYKRLAERMCQPTGIYTQMEVFLAEGELSNGFMENCVAFSWIQLSFRMYDLTNDAYYLSFAEVTAYNHTLSAISPDGSTWSYHLRINGPKGYAFFSQIESTDKNTGAPITCCHTNGQRALGLFPQYFYCFDKENVYVNFFGESSAEGVIGNGNKIHIDQKTSFPKGSNVKLIVKPDIDDKFLVNIRFPANIVQMTINDKEYNKNDSEYVVLEACGDTVFDIQITLEPVLLALGYTNLGKFTIALGPLVYAVDQAPQGIELSQLCLVLDRDEPFGACRKIYENGWLCLEVPCIALAKKCVDTFDINKISAQKKTALFRPVMFTGLKTDNNRQYSQEDDTHILTFDRDSITPAKDKGWIDGFILPEYRVIYPCLFM
jgi:DUF1680 family protein